ncbi:MATE family efflux transporter [Ruminococcus sp. Marseille-P6503]|uniref:MATE family efflux transporter n=1 Tax=Ruminococcus sp. Marseille-P6503 TaxID=2364796 RepID=UPI000F51BC7F|nr:MATE family efflux transporter [Ruminococcus sp. Marseille-P6503]
MDEQVLSENKMGVQPINKLILSMSLPIMISMLIQALYNIVDSIFVSKISENAFTAVSLAFPVQNLMIAVAAGTGVGINALLSKSLGERNFQDADKTAHNGIFLTFIHYLIFLIFGLFFTGIFFEAQSKNSEIIAYGKEYLSICLVSGFGILFEITFERLLQATGRTMYTMFTQGAGAIINIILDPCLIFGLGPFPEMGIAGAAIATVIGQIAAMLMGLVFNIKFNKEISMSMRGFRPCGRIIKRIYSVGIPSIIMQSITSVMTFGMNKILGGFADTAQAVLGAYFKLQSFVFMPVFGLNNGMVPVLSYNYGARNKKRMTDTIKISVIYAMILMLIGFALMQLVPNVLLEMFEASENMMSMGVTALRIISISFLFAGFCIIISSSLQALGHGLFSMLISIARQLIVLLPVAYLLSRLGDVAYVWWAFPIAEISSVCCSVLFIRHIYKKVIKPIGD